MEPKQSSPSTTSAEHGVIEEPPILPPEIVRQIFSNLKGRFRTLDLLACSLTCTTWFHEAFPLLGDDLQWIHCSVFDDDGETITRFAELITESHRLRLPHCDQITQLNISVAYLVNRPLSMQEDGKFCDTSAKAYRDIIRRAPNLRTLYIFTRWPRNSFLSTRDWDRCYDGTKNQILLFFESIMPLCNSITGLVFFCESGFDTFISHVIESVADRLEFLKTRHLTFNDATKRALCLCHSMRDVDIRNTKYRDVTPVLHCWQYLEKFCIYDSFSHLDIAEADRLAIELGTYCPNLVEVVFQQCNDDVQMSSQAMCYLLGRCPNLTHLGATSNQLDDRFLRALANGQPHLERLILPKCIGIIGHLVKEDAPAWGWWPELRQLVLVECESVLPEFVERLVRECSKLKTVALPSTLEQICGKLLVQLGFRLEHCDEDFEFCYVTDPWWFDMMWQRVETDNVAI
ncbi:hypothetical protein BC938DRAFT_479728 [Jimgerdemannia flammicorona]|uniref:F-box domain-containing protein n=1 Tax=Jimgerdemannia flammicorona TaxID=994334 RepID=A0A433QK86_9FUNG|nr:hypothetical protein BC938DRAFT_479728 [Jimgerdemannia flammicorona]